MSKPKPYEELLLKQMLDKGIPEPVREYKFLENRRFKSDFAWPDQKFMVEVDGAIWTGGRHTSGVGFTRDTEKFALATIEGWRVIRVTTGQVKSGEAIEWIVSYVSKYFR